MIAGTTSGDEQAGVAFPAAADGRRSTSALGQAVVADALRRVDPDAAQAASREANWRAGYLGQVAVAMFTVPHEQPVNAELFKGRNNVIDDHVFKKLLVVPERLRPLLKRCLEKDARRRLRDIGDFELLLEQRPYLNLQQFPPLRGRRLRARSPVIETGP